MEFKHDEWVMKVCEKKGGKGKEGHFLEQRGKGEPRAEEESRE